MSVLAVACSFPDYTFSDKEFYGQAGDSSVGEGGGAGANVGGHGAAGASGTGEHAGTGGESAGHAGEGAGTGGTSAGSAGTAGKSGGSAGNEGGSAGTSGGSGGKTTTGGAGAGGAPAAGTGGTTVTAGSGGTTVTAGSGGSVMVGGSGGSVAGSGGKGGSVAGSAGKGGSGPILCTSQPDNHSDCPAGQTCCPAGQTCSGFDEAPNGSAEFYCQTINPTGAPVGTNCVNDPDCADRDCFTSSNTCTIVCNFVDDCGGTSVCTEFSFSATQSQGFCVRSCTTDAECNEMAPSSKLQPACVLQTATDIDADTVNPNPGRFVCLLNDITDPNNLAFGAKPTDVQGCQDGAVYDNFCTRPCNLAHNDSDCAAPLPFCAMVKFPGNADKLSVCTD